MSIAAQSVALEHIPCAAACVDGAGRITSANSSFADLWVACGCLPSDFAREELGSLFDLRDRRTFRDALARSPGAHVVPLSLRLASRAALVTVECAALARTAEAGTGWLTLIRPAAPAVGDGPWTTDAQTVAAIAHDLRGPLQAVLGWVSMLREQPMDPDRVAKVLSIVERNARLQAAMLDELACVTRQSWPLRRGGFRPVDVPALVAMVAEGLRPSARERGITLEVRAVAGASVWGDQVGLARIINNLLLNALKFAQNGGRVRCTVRAGREWIRLAVCDDGIGISEEFLPYVFEPLRRETASGRVMPEGTGLGLANVKALVDLHGGRVTAASKGPGRGATFVVWLPHLRSEDSRSTVPAPLAFRAKAN